MGRGKIVITNQQPQQQRSQAIQNDQNGMGSKSQKKKLKNKIRKQKKKEMKKATIEMIADSQLQHNGEKNEEANGQSNAVENETENKKTYFGQKYKLKHLAICFPDSILEIPQTSTLRSYFISEVARICSIFKVDQLIVLKDHGYNAKSQNFSPSQYIARNLQYLETPQYLRKHLFKMHPDLKNAGIMNPIQCHHHLKADDVCEFREGVTVDRPTKSGAGSWVDIGLKQQASMDCMVPPGTRVTLRLLNYQDQTTNYYQAKAVSKKIPMQQKGLYWGYDVRLANNFKQMLKSVQYDIKIICNHHKKIQTLQQLQNFSGMDLQDKSMLIFFSGTDDLETLIAKDDKAVMKLNDILEFFDYSLNFQNFGVQKLRMEEQLFMGLGQLANFVY